jgi:nicotinamide-nucleotide amidase
LCTTTGQESHPALKIYLEGKYTRKTYLVNAFGKLYNIGMPQNIISQVHASLIRSKRTVSVAESCTGGLLSTMLTELSGSSKYFILGIVTYSNKAKERMLGIPASVIAKNGAVSEIVAKLMAQKVRRLAKTDFGIGITGIAGPSGGTLRKPVGTVFIAVASKNKTICQKLLLSSNRFTIKKKAALKALSLLHAHIHRH